MLPLHGLRVIEFCQFAAGPYCGMVLGDMGADVIKVEPPGSGDNLRQWPPMIGDFSALFVSLNRNKRSIALDLKNPEDSEVARELCLSADVVLENFRPGTMAKFGLDYPSLRGKAPDLVYCSVSAYGQSGPRAAEGGFDLTLQAIAGVMSVTGEADGAPVKCGVPIADFCTALHAAFAIAAALRKVDRGEGGEHIDISMMGATLGVAALQTHAYFGSGESPGRMGSAHHRNASSLPGLSGKGRLFRDGRGKRPLMAQRLRNRRTYGLARRSAIPKRLRPFGQPGRPRGASREGIRPIHRHRYSRRGL